MSMVFRETDPITGQTIQITPTRTTISQPSSLSGSSSTTSTGAIPNWLRRLRDRQNKKQSPFLFPGIEQMDTQPAPPTTEEKYERYSQFYGKVPDTIQKRIPSPTAYSLYLQGLTPNTYKTYESVTYAGKTFHPGKDSYSALVQHGEQVQLRLEKTAPIRSFINYIRTGKHPFEIPAEVSYFGRGAEREYVQTGYQTWFGKLTQEQASDIISRKITRRYLNLSTSQQAGYNVKFLKWESIPLWERRYYPGWSEYVSQMSPEKKYNLQSEVIAWDKTGKGYPGLAKETIVKRLKQDYGKQSSFESYQGKPIFPTFMELATQTPEEFKLTTFKGMSTTEQYKESFSSAVLSVAAFPVTLPQMGVKYLTGQGNAWDFLGRVGSGKTVVLPDISMELEKRRVGVPGGISLWMEEGVYKLQGGKDLSPGMSMAKKYPGQMTFATFGEVVGFYFGGKAVKGFSTGISTGLKWGVKSIPKVIGKTSIFFGESRFFKVTTNAKLVPTTEIVHYSGSVVKPSTTIGVTEQGAFIRPTTPPPAVNISFPKGAMFVTETRPGFATSFIGGISQSQLWGKLYGYSTGKLQFVKTFKARGKPVYLEGSATGVQVGEQTFYGSLRRFSGFGKRELVPTAKAQQFSLGKTFSHSHLIREGKGFMEREQLFITRSITGKGFLWKRIKVQTSSVSETETMGHFMIKGDIGPPSIMRMGSWTRAAPTTGSIAEEVPVLWVIKKTPRKAGIKNINDNAYASLTSPIGATIQAGQHISSGLTTHGATTGLISISTAEIGSEFTPIAVGSAVFSKLKWGEENKQQPMVRQIVGSNVRPRSETKILSIVGEEQVNVPVSITRRRHDEKSSWGVIDDEIRIPISGEAQKQRELQTQRLALVLQSRRISLQMKTPSYEPSPKLTFKSKIRMVPPPSEDEEIQIGGKFNLSLKREPLSLKRSKGREKSVLADPFSVMESQIKFGKATHQIPTRRVWREAERAGWKLGTVEMRKEKMGKMRLTKKGHKKRKYKKR